MWTANSSFACKRAQASKLNGHRDGDSPRIFRRKQRQSHFQAHISHRTTTESSAEGKRGEGKLSDWILLSDL